MSGKKAVAPQDNGPGHIVSDDAPPKKKKKGKLMIIVAAAVVLLLGGIGAVGFTGILKLPFLSHKAHVRPAQQAQAQFIKLPELIANLNAGPDADSYVKMQTEIEVTDPASAAAVTAQMPAIIDLFQTYLRAMQPDDLRGSDGLYRLREALLARANTIVAPREVQNILFIEMVVQ